MILVYFDKGVDPLSAKQLVKGFRELGHEVSRINHEGLRGDWDADVLVIPGGLDIWYHELLKGEACAKIRAFKGKYLGICAGAYFGSAIVDFERGHEHAIVGERELCFYKGRAEGPALGLGTFDPNSRKGAAMTKVNWGGERSVFYNGGCRFLDVEPQEVLATFQDGTPAVIRENNAILCGVHPEYSAKWIGSSDPHLNALKPELEAAEEDRAFLFHALAEALAAF